MEKSRTLQGKSDRDMTSVLAMMSESLSTVLLNLLQIYEVHEKCLSHGPVHKRRSEVNGTSKTPGGRGLYIAGEPLRAQQWSVAALIS